MWFRYLFGMTLSRPLGNAPEIQSKYKISLVCISYSYIVFYFSIRGRGNSLNFTTDY